MDRIYWLDQIKSQDRTKVGDKAFYLSKIVQRGYPVTPGFVVSAEVLREFLETLNSSEALVADLPHSSLHLDVNNWRQLQQVAGRVRQEITSAHLSSYLVETIFKAARELETAYLIFRPSLVTPSVKLQGVSMSGLLESQVCQCNEDAIAAALKHTWSQIFRAKSLLYWQWVGIDLQQIHLGVLVQPLRSAIASGLLNASSTEWEVLATWGLGMGIVRGDVLPDVYYIQPETGFVREQQLGNKMLAYGVDDAASMAALQGMAESTLLSEDSCLKSYILTEDQQKKYSLPEEYLQQLIKIASQFVKEFGTTFAIEWSVSNGTSNGALNITQVNTPLSSIPNFHHIKGLGAAVGCVTANAHVILNSQEKPEQISKGVIVVAPTIAPDWLPLLQSVVGIITEQGGLTSHAAILARELGIPAIVSVPNATNIIQNGERLRIDGNKGEVYRIVRDAPEVEHEDAEIRGNKTVNSLKPSLPDTSWRVSTSVSPSPPSHLPIIATQLMVNLSQPSLIEQVQNLPVDGVGLLRSELMILNILEGQHPNNWLREGNQAQLQERWRDLILQFARAFAPKPVLYRSLDWRSHELPSDDHNTPSSVQSMLGERGTFSYMKNLAVFDLELAVLAAVQKAGYNNVQLILPFVRTVEEFSFCRQKVDQAKLTQLPQFQLWIMAEVPSVLFLLPQYVKAGVQGISIGTNDLTQLLLGVDREQGHLAQTFDERHPVVMGAVAQLIKMAKDAKIPCSICGQAPVLYPEIIDKLVEWGITSISVEPEAVPRTHLSIARAEQRIILEAARRHLTSEV
ncbi:MAG: putative PEP-binding protein [Scytonema sp. PMC 1069.18]|nr:putative PEP-binding protein [Scytonema sp. PMC 1069.18]MEC4881684.1 putative PEP-binding protein [Scytonema sp. PMC 1070.18]